jgi:hypothetical protein
VEEELRAMVTLSLEGWEAPRPSRDFYRPGLELESLSLECRALTKDQLIELQHRRDVSGGNPPRNARKGRENGSGGGGNPPPSVADPDREAALAELQAIGEKRAELAEDVERLAGKLEDAKNGVGTGGLALTVALGRLMQKHGLRPANPAPLDLGPPIDAPSIRIRAIGATTDLDLSRSRFSPTCKWPMLDPARIRLLMHHDEARGAVGRVEEIAFDGLGRMVVVATVTDKQAMTLPAVSISAAVGKFTIRHPESASLVFADIEEVTDISELSLTRTPANLSCRVLERWIPSPVEQSSQALIDKFRDLQATVAALQASGVFSRAA